MPLLLFAAVLASTLFPLTDADIWWHLAAGRQMIASRSLLFADPFSSDALGQPWVDVHWLFQLLVYGAHQLGGLAAIVVLKGAVVGCGALVLLGAARAAGGRNARAVTALLLASALHLARYLVLARPVVLTLLYLALFLLVLERFRRDGKPRALLWLLPVQVLWVNSQGLFLLGPAVIACYLAGEAATRALARLGAAGFASPLGPRQLALLGGALLGALGASLVSPYGADSFALALRLLGRIDATGDALLFAHNVSENVPPWLLERVPGEPIACFKWIAAAVFASFLLCWRRPPLSRLLLVSAMFGAALLANRNVLLFYWVAAPAAALNLATFAKARAAWLAPARVATATAAALGVVLAVAAVRGRTEGPLSAPAPFRTPAAAVDVLLRSGLRGGLFNSVRYGSYLAWAGVPRWRPIIDGRLVLRPARRFAEHLALLDRPETFARFRAAHDLRVALLPTAYPERYLGLVRTLYRDPDWRLLYTDGTQTLLAHRTAATPPPRGLDLGQRATVQRILVALQREHRGRPALLGRATIHFARLLAVVGEPERAAELLAAPLADPLEDRLRRGLRARVEYLAGRTEHARATCHALLRADPEELSCLLLLALLDTDAQRYAQAVGWAERALRTDPFNAEARRILARIRAERAAR